MKSFISLNRASRNKLFQYHSASTLSLPRDIAQTLSFTSFRRRHQPQQQWYRSLASSPAQEPHGHESGLSDKSTLSTNSQHSRSQQRRRPLYVAATRQHVGKTTTSLALVAGLQKRVGKVGFIKPVGQQSLHVNEDDGQEVACDKDAVLVKQHFQLDHLQYKHMSPVLIPPGYTKDYIDGKITQDEQRHLLTIAQQEVAEVSDVVVCEGTGHVAVGSVVDASNAEVAALMGAKMVLVANGGLGNALDELELNKVFCDKYGVDIAGVIINKVIPDKYEQTRYYLSKALKERWGDVPLLGLIPDRPFLGCPAIADLERLFPQSTMISGADHRFRHYTVNEVNLVATSLEVFLHNVQHVDSNRTLYVTHASRNDILLGFLMEAQQRGISWEAAMIVTGCGDHPISQQVLDMTAIHDQSAYMPPVVLVQETTAQVMNELHRYTPKLNFEDNHRVETAISHYEKYIDFPLLLERLAVNELEAESAQV